MQMEVEALHPLAQQQAPLLQRLRPLQALRVAPARVAGPELRLQGSTLQR